MPYPKNYTSTVVSGVVRGGLYTDPVTSANYLAGVCNYSPVKPCYREDFRSESILQDRPYNPNEFSLNNLMRTLRDIASAERLSALNSTVTLNPVITTAQKQEISADFYAGLSNI